MVFTNETNNVLEQRSLKSVIEDKSSTLSFITNWIQVRLLTISFDFAIHTFIMLPVSINVTLFDFDRF